MKPFLSLIVNTKRTQLKVPTTWNIIQSTLYIFYIELVFCKPYPKHIIYLNAPSILFHEWV